VACRPADAGLQDHRRFPQRQRSCDPGGLHAIRGALPPAQPVHPAIDGSKFKAVNNRDKNFTVAKVGKRMEEVEASIARYLAALDRADREDGDIAEARTARLTQKIEGLRRQMQSPQSHGAAGRSGF
jgi:hypothetical protein